MYYSFSHSVFYYMQLIHSGIIFIEHEGIFIVKNIYSKKKHSGRKNKQKNKKNINRIDNYKGKYWFQKVLS